MKFYAQLTKHLENNIEWLEDRKYWLIDFQGQKRTIGQLLKSSAGGYFFRWDEDKLKHPEVDLYSFDYQHYNKNEKAVVKGQHNVIYGEDNQIDGDSNQVNGLDNIISGNANNITGEGNVVKGKGNKVYGQKASIEGNMNLFLGVGND